jgi:hypothetical protein
MGGQEYVGVDAPACPAFANCSHLNSGARAWVRRVLAVDRSPQHSVALYAQREVMYTFKPGLVGPWPPNQRAV